MESWQWLCDFNGPNPRGFVVRVNILPLFDPKYSIEIGMMIGGVLRRHLPGDMDGEEAQKISELLSEALHHVGELKERRMADRKAADEELIKKEREKRARHQANVQARRETNRQASKNAGGGKRAGK